MATLLLSGYGTVTAGLAESAPEDPAATVQIRPDDSARVDELLQELQTPGQDDYTRIEKQIEGEWSKSGSASMDLLLERGRTAMAAQDWATAIDFLTALTDHAPEFAEGWNSRAVAYFNAGLYGPSIEDLRHALALNPRHFGAMSGLAMIMEQVGRPTDALMAWKQVAELMPFDDKVRDTIKRLETAVGGKTL